MGDDEGGAVRGVQEPGSAPDAGVPAAGVRRRELVNVAYLGASFCIMFSAFTVAQNFATSDTRPQRMPGSGYWSLALLYAAFCSTTMFSGWVVKMLGARAAIVGGSVPYVLFVAANIYPAAWLLLPTALLLGAGAALLWTAQGTYLALNSTMDTLNGNSSIFFGLFIFNAVVGNLAAGGALQLLDALGFSADAAMTILFVLMTALCVSGAALFLLLRPAPRAEAAYVRGSLGQTLKDILHTLRMFLRPDMLLLAVTMVYSGLSQSYYYGMFPKHVADVTQESFVGYTLALFGAADTLGSFGFGKVADATSRTSVFLLGTALSAIGTTCAYFSEGEGWPLALLWIAPVFMGLADAVYNTQIYAVVGTFCPRPDAEAGFAFFKLIQSGSTAASFFYSSWLSLLSGHWGWFVGNAIMIGSLAASTVTLAILRFAVHSIEVPAEPLRQL